MSERTQIEVSNHAFEQLFQADDGVDLVGGWIQANDHIAAAVTEAVKDREENLLVVIARAVRLDP